MSGTRGYKKIENAVVRFCINSFRWVFSIVLGFFRGIVKVGSRRLTIMIVPHSQKSAFNFQTNVFSFEMVREHKGD